MRNLPRLQDSTAIAIAEALTRARRAVSSLSEMPAAREIIDLTRDDAEEEQTALPPSLPFPPMAVAVSQRQQSPSIRIRPTSNLPEQEEQYDSETSWSVDSEEDRLYLIESKRLQDSNGAAPPLWALMDEFSDFPIARQYRQRAGIGANVEEASRTSNDKASTSREEPSRNARQQESFTKAPTSPARRSKRAKKPSRRSRE